MIRQARLLEYSHREVAPDSRVADPAALRLHERQRDGTRVDRRGLAVYLVAEKPEWDVQIGVFGER